MNERQNEVLSALFIITVPNFATFYIIAEIFRVPTYQCFGQCYGTLRIQHFSKTPTEPGSDLLTNPNPDKDFKICSVFFFSSCNVMYELCNWNCYNCFSFWRHKADFLGFFLPRILDRSSGTTDPDLTFWKVLREEKASDLTKTLDLDPSSKRLKIYGSNGSGFRIHDINCLSLNTNGNSFYGPM